tara:strand:+ start:313 stop:438 length:126 start_codon:yes stop_codon:yes gene_type:complete
MGDIVLKEWKEFRTPDFDETKAQLFAPVLFDGIKQYNVFKL